MWVFLCLIAIVAVLIVKLILEGRENYGIIESGNIPVVPTSLFLGSETDYHKKVLHFEDMKRFKKYGKVWGTYVGKSPQVHIADPELIKQIFVRDYEYFYDRQTVDLGVPVMNEFLDWLPGEKWKTVRQILSPLFTSSKLKVMSEVIGDSAQEFVQDLKSECQNGRLKIDCRNRLTAWLIDMFALSTLGVRLEGAKNPYNKFAEAFRQLIGEYTSYNFLYTLSLTFPFFARFAPTFYIEPAQMLESTMRSIIKQRKQGGSRNSKDFVDFLNELLDKVPTAEFKRLGITEDTIISQALNFFLGGYETSGTTLSHVLYELAKHPEAQDKIKSEVDSILERFDGKINYDSVKEAEIPYTMAVINEILRLAPPVIRPERICNKDWHYEPMGISIKKGTIVAIACWAANRNPDVYTDPEEFKPERFLPENKSNLNPYAFTSFGHGHRNCVGMRFAYENIKLFLMHFMKDFTVELRPESRFKYKNGSAFFPMFEPLYLDLVLRD